jgi:hypothetical protein
MEARESWARAGLRTERERRIRTANPNRRETGGGATL